MNDLSKEIAAKHEEMMKKALEEAEAQVRAVALEAGSSCEVKCGTISPFVLRLRLQDRLGNMFLVSVPSKSQEGASASGDGAKLVVTWTIPLSQVYHVKTTSSGWD